MSTIRNQDIVDICNLFLYASTLQILFGSSRFSIETIGILVVGIASIMQKRLESLWCIMMLFVMYKIQANVVSAIVMILVYWWIEWRWAPSCTHILFYSLARVPYNFLLYTWVGYNMK